MAKPKKIKDAVWPEPMRKAPRPSASEAHRIGLNARAIAANTPANKAKAIAKAITKGKGK